MQPLKGLTVVTLEHAIAAPFATRQLADLGARVIKIERPGVGDFARGYDSRVRGLASHFVWTNRSKESLTLDVKHPEAAKVLERLVLEKADVVVQNLAPGAAARLGLGYERLAAAEAVDHRLRHLGLRRRRSLPRQEGLRPADPERGRLRVGDRHARRAVQGRPLDRRHRRRHVRLHQHPRRVAAARRRPARASTSTSRCWSRWPSGPATRCTTPSMARRRRRAPARPTPPSTPTGPFPTGDGGSVMLGLQNEREWVNFCDKVLLQPGAREGPALHRQRQARGRAHGAARRSSSKPSSR